VSANPISAAINNTARTRRVRLRPLVCIAIVKAAMQIYLGLGDFETQTYGLEVLDDFSDEPVEEEPDSLLVHMPMTRCDRTSVPILGICRAVRPLGYRNKEYGQPVLRVGTCQNRGTLAPWVPRVRIVDSDGPRSSHHTQETILTFDYGFVTMLSEDQNLGIA
jgi:hypothetical protein